MKNTLLKIKPIKMEKNLEQRIVWGLKTLHTILGHKK